MVGVPVFSDWRQFSATLIHVHVSTHCVTFRVSHSSSRTMYLGRSLSRSSSSSPPNEHDFSRGEHHAGLRSPRATCQPTKTTRYLSLSANLKLKRRALLKPRLLLLLLLLFLRLRLLLLFFFSAKSRGFRSERQTFTALTDIISDGTRGSYVCQ